MNGTRHRSCDVAIGCASDAAGNGIAYAHIASGSGATTVRVPFGVALPGDESLHERALTFAAVAAVGAYLRGFGYTRVRLSVGDEEGAAELNARAVTAPALATAYVKTRCVLHGFSAARVEHAAPGETLVLRTRALADVSLRTVTPEATKTP